MEELFLAVMRRFGAKIPELGTIDEDYGQLSVGEGQDTYPVIFPAALVSLPEVTWITQGRNQHGKGKLMVRIAQDCYDDTHLGSGTEVKIRERQQLNGRACRALHYFQPLDDMGPMEREKSVEYTLDGPGNIKICEMTFAFEIVEQMV